MQNSKEYIKKAIIKLNKAVPEYVIIPVVLCVVWNSVVYSGSRVITAGMKHYDMTLPIDNMIPVIPAFTVIYFGCYVSWIIYYIASMRVGRKECARFLTFDLLTRACCAVFYLSVPTYNVRPDITGGDIFSEMLRFLYRIDEANNLFPSIHCIVSWNCFIGIREQKCYKKGFKITAAIIALLVFASTLVTKQHVIVDVVSAVIISELFWWLVNYTSLYKYTYKLMEKLGGFLRERKIYRKIKVFVGETVSGQE